MKNKRSRWRAGFHPLRFLFGYSRIAFKRSELERALNLLKEEGIECGDIELFEDIAELGVPFFSNLSICLCSGGTTLLSSTELIPYLLFTIFKNSVNFSSST